MIKGWLISYQVFSVNQLIRELNQLKGLMKILSSNKSFKPTMYNLIYKNNTEDMNSVVAAALIIL